MQVENQRMAWRPKRAKGIVTEGSMKYLNYTDYTLEIDNEVATRTPKPSRIPTVKKGIRIIIDLLDYRKLLPERQEQIRERKDIYILNSALDAITNHTETIPVGLV